MYICTCADDYFFPQLLNFIGSLHKVNFNEIKEIAVFNLGFKDGQVEHLDSIQKVKVYEVEKVHPDILTYFEKGPSDKKQVRGLYSWKPVAIKQALDMFPYVLYSDAGVVILKPLNNLFKHIVQNGYFLITSPHDIKFMCPEHVIETFDLGSEERKWILSPKTDGLSAGFQGLSRELYDTYVYPMYTLAHDINNFVDDGTAQRVGRHDQVLFSITARLLGLEIDNWKRAQYRINDKKIRFRMKDGLVKFWAREKKWNKMKKYIKYKN